MSDRYYRDTVLDVDITAIEKNYKAIQAKNHDKTFIAVVKAESYGLGAEVVGNHLAVAGVTFFAVATLDEAIALRMHGIKEKILVLGTINPEQINKAIQHRIAVTAPNLNWINDAIDNVDNKYDKSVWIHIKVNCAMNRYGTDDIDEISAMIDRINHFERFIYEGIYSHFTSSDIEGSETHEEFEKFKGIVQAVEQPSYIHMSNSGGALLLEEDFTTAVRSGISLYGYYPSDYVKNNTSVKLIPSVRLTSEICGLHQLKAGDSVSYGRTYTANQDEVIATLPIGYADGLMRQHKGYTVRLEDGKECQIVGTICMDATMIKVPAGTELGQIVTIVDDNADSKQSLEQFSEYVDTITYESLCAFSKRLPRRYKNETETFILNEVIN